MGVLAKATRTGLYLCFKTNRSSIIPISPTVRIVMNVGSILGIRLGSRVYVGKRAPIKLKRIARPPISVHMGFAGLCTSTPTIPCAFNFLIKVGVINNVMQKARRISVKARIMSVLGFPPLSEA